MQKLLLLRHGESLWNKENRFTGWTDVDLTERGRDEARRAGQLMKIEVLDHVIVGRPNHVSLRELGYFYQ